MRNLIKTAIITSSHGERKMVSWGYAFKKGLFIWLWGIVWGIIGAIIAIVISGGSLLAVLTSSDPASAVTGALIGIFVGVLIGALVATIGQYASIVKIILGSVEEKKST